MRTTIKNAALAVLAGLGLCLIGSNLTASAQERNGVETSPEVSPADGAARISERVYIQATMSKNILVFDAFSFEQLDEIDVGAFTDDVEGAPDGSVIYANAQYDSGHPLAWNVNHAGKVFALDARDHSVLWSTDLDGSPHHLVVSPDGKTLYVPLFDRHEVLAVDTKTGEVRARWHAFMGGHSLEMNEDGSRLYVGNMIADSIMVFDTAAGRLVQIINTADGVRPLQIDEPNNRVIYQLSRLHGFKTRSLETGELLETIDLPELPEGVGAPALYPHTLNHGLIITPDRKYLLAAASIEGYVTVHDLDSLDMIARIDVGEDPNWIEVRSDSQVAFVSNRGDNTMSVIDLREFRQIAKLPAGEMPQRLDIVRTPIAD